MRHQLDFPSGKPYDAVNPPDPNSQDVADVLAWVKKHTTPLLHLEAGEEISLSPAGNIRDLVVWATFKGVTLRYGLLVVANSPADFLYHLNIYLGVPYQRVTDFFIHPERIPDEYKRKDPPANPVGKHAFATFYEVAENDPRPLGARWIDERGEFLKVSLNLFFSGGGTYWNKVA